MQSKSAASCQPPILYPGTTASRIRLAELPELYRRMVRRTVSSSAFLLRFLFGKAWTILEIVKEDESQAGFPQTQWSLVIAAGSVASPAHDQALDDLCRAYWKPLYTYLRREGNQPSNAADLTQGFLVAMLSRDGFRHAQPGLGPFRRYLLSCLTNWVTNQEISQKTAKRGGGKVFSFDPEDAEALLGADQTAENPEKAYDKSYFLTLISRANQRLTEEQRARGKEGVYRALAGFLQGADANDYQNVGIQLGMAPGTVAQTVRRLRLRLREFIEDEVRQTVSSPEDFELEIRELKQALNS